MTAFELMLSRHVNSCPAMRSQGRLDKVYAELFNGDDGEHGFIAEQRRLHLEMSNKISFVHGAAKTWSVVLGALLTTFLGLAIWTFQKVYPAFNQIMADYYAHHPAAQLQPNKSAVDPGEVYTVRMNSPQSVTNEPHMQ
jgi:hypothetical protein